MFRLADSRTQLECTDEEKYPTTGGYTNMRTAVHIVQQHSLAIESCAWVRLCCSGLHFALQGTYDFTRLALVEIKWVCCTPMYQPKQLPSPPHLTGCTIYTLHRLRPCGYNRCVCTHRRMRSNSKCTVGQHAVAPSAGAPAGCR